MQSLFNIINIPLSYILKFLSDIFGGNFAASVFVFTLLANIALIPLSIKSQKSSVQQMRLKPKLDELKKRYGDDRQKMAEAQQKLYQEENVSMSGGCLPLIIRLVLMMSIYWLILSPLTYMSGADKTKVNNVTTAISTNIREIKKDDAERYEKFKKETNWNEKNSNNQLGIIRLIRENPEEIKQILPKKEYKKIKGDLEYIIEKDEKAGIDYSFLGMDLTQSPQFNIDIFSKFQKIWLLPIMAFLAQMLTSVVSMLIQKKNNPDAPSMAGMMLTMPLISLFIGFTFPGGVCFYWICSSLIGGFIQSGVQIVYGPHKMLAKERAKEIKKQCEFEEKQLEKF